MIPQYRYLLSYGADQHESQPVTGKSLTIKTEKESGEVFFRDKLASPLVFLKTDYAWLLERELAEERCGELKITIGAKYPLERAAEAHADLEGRKTTGKLILNP